MKFKKILLLGYNGKELKKQYWDKMDKLGEKKVFLEVDDPVVEKNLKETDCLLVKLGAKVNKEMVKKMPKLKYIGMLGTGVGGIDVKYAAGKNIAVCNIADYATQAVAEFSFAMILEYFRELERAKQQAKKGDYSEETYTGTEIGGKKFGVIGLGNIGIKTAKLAKAFGAEVFYWSKNRKKKYEKMGIKYKGIDSLLKNSDIISINLSLNPKTENFLNKKRVNMIKKGAVVINPSPMELVDLKALVARLKKKDMVFILDHADEMAKKEVKLIKPFKNCIIYPPIGYTTNEATARKQGIFVDNLENFLKGKTSNKVN